MDDKDCTGPACDARSRTAGHRRLALLLLIMAGLLAVTQAVSACESTETTTTSTTGVGSTAGATTTSVAEGAQFSDVPSTHPYFMEIADLSSRGIVSGFQDGTFRPDDPVTRQQFAKMIVKTLGFPVTGAETCPFTDVPARIGEDPFYPSKYVAVCAVEGIVRGTSSTTFSPNRTLSRAQLITMVARAAGLPEVPSGYATPFGNFSADHYPWARKAYYHGLLDGLEGIKERGYPFWNDTSRGEACALLYALLHKDQTP